MCFWVDFSFARKSAIKLSSILPATTFQVNCFVEIILFH